MCNNRYVAKVGGLVHQGADLVDGELSAGRVNGRFYGKKRASYTMLARFRGDVFDNNRPGIESEQIWRKLRLDRSEEQ